MTDYELTITSYKGIVAGATHFRGRVQGPYPQSCHGGTVYHGGGPPELRGKTTCQQNHILPDRDEWDVEAAWTEERFSRWDYRHFEGAGPGQFPSEQAVIETAIFRFSGRASRQWWEHPDVVAGMPGDRLLYDGEVIAEIPDPVFRGQVSDWRGIRCLVTRAARDGSWADIRCHAEDGSVWSKRQKLPFGEDWELTGEYVVMS